MAMKPWMPLVAAMALATGLAGCGNGDEPAPAEVEETQEAAAQPAEVAESQQETDQPAAEPDEADVSDDQSSSAEASEEGQASAADQAGGDLEEPGELDIGTQGEVDAEAETLGETPADTLEEGAALPGETTRSDVDAIIEETERRFQEASRRIDEQFESAEEAAPGVEPMESSPALEPMETPELEPMESSDLESEIGLDTSPGSEMAEGDAMPGESTRSDIDAILEQTEKRFEEASRQIDEQFEEAERQAPGASSELDSLELDGTGSAGE